MGNNPSKPESKAVSSPVASHSSSSSTTNSQREPRSLPLSARNANAPTTSQPSTHRSQNHSLSKSHSHSPSNSHSNPNPYVSYSPSQRNHQDDRMGNEQSRQKRKDKKEQSTPVRVPRGADPRRQRGPDSQFEPSGPPRDPDYIPHSNLNFPPRLPLPIEEEVHKPGSPITPSGFSSALHEEDVGVPLVRQGSGLSSTTVDDDDVGDELQPFPLDNSRRTVPTVINWKQGGEKVYVTGTFTSWNRKFRMNRDPATNVLSTVLQLPPGTHHVKFIVDGDMQLSKELPTAVDFTNILVNYIEVSADDIPREPAKEYKVPEGLFPPQVLPQEIETKDHEPSLVGKSQAIEGEIPSVPLYWGDNIPKYLQDFGLPEHTRRYQRAARGVKGFSTPPSLPLFLGKSILNGTTPMKDDSSVLNIPSHTILNHLTTSSIKNQVLATSVTTRYKRKYLTTIMHRPIVDDGD